MKIHTIQLNIEAITASCQHMDALEFGAYMSLLICAYRSNGKLVNDDKRLARMAKCSLKTWKKINSDIKKKFEIVDDCLIHFGIQKEIVKYQKLSHKNRSNALKRNKTVQPLANPMGKPNVSQTSANINNKDIYILKEKEKEKDKKEKEKESTNFVDSLIENLWDIYPDTRGTKGNKNLFFQLIRNYLQNGENYETIRTGLENYKLHCETGKEYNLNAEKWAKDRKWKQEFKTIRRIQDKSSPEFNGGKETSRTNKIIDIGEKAKKILDERNEDN